MKVPSNYGPVKPNKTLRKGDIYIHKNDSDVSGVMAHNNPSRTAGSYPDYIFYRRRHIRQAPVVHTLTSAADVTKQQAKNITVVSFGYPSSKWDVMIHRIVQLISFDDKYLIGLEWVEKRNGRREYQFKKFLRSRINSGRIQLVKYGPPD